MECPRLRNGTITQWPLSLRPLRMMKQHSGPLITHTLDKEPHVTVFVQGNVNTSMPTLLAVSPKHGVFVGDPSLHAVYRIQHGHVSELVYPTENPVAGDFNDVCPAAMAYHHIRESLIIVDNLHHVVREIELSEDVPDVAYGTVWTLAGASGPTRCKPGYKDGPALKSKFSSPSGVCVTLWGDILVSDTNNDVIRLIREERVTTFAGNGARGFRDGNKHSARFNNPTGLTSNAQGDVFVCDTGNRRVRLIDESGEVSTLAGSGEEGLDDGAHLSAKFFQIERLCLTDRGDLIVIGHNIRMIHMSGQVTTLAECSEAYVQKQSELASLHAMKRPFRQRLFDLLTLKSIMTEAPTKTVVSTKRSREHNVYPTNDPTYNIQRNDAQNFLDPHGPLGCIGDVAFTPDGDLLVANPITHCIKQIQGALSLLYPLQGLKISASDALQLIPASPTKTTPYSAFKRSQLDYSCTLETLIDNANPFTDYEITITTKGGETVTKMLNTIVLFLVCPSLLIDSTVHALSQLHPSAEVLGTLWTYIYSGRLPTEAQLPLFWAELALVSRTVNLNALAQYACYRTYRALQYEDSVDMALRLLREMPMSTQIFDAISEFISTKRGFATRSTKSIKRRISLSESLPKRNLASSTKLRAPPTPPSSLSTSPSDSASSTLPPKPITRASTQPILSLSKSAPLLIGRCLTDPSTIASRVRDHSRIFLAGDRKLHEKNKVNPYGLLQDQLPTLGAMLKNAPARKDSLLPFPEMFAPDFYLRVDGEYIPCHGCILYARWPWFRARIDAMSLVMQREKTSRTSITPFSPADSVAHSSVDTMDIPPSKRNTNSIGAATVSSPTSVSPTQQKHTFSLDYTVSRISGSFSRERSLDIPAGTLSAVFVRGFVFYLYSGEVHKIPPSCVNSALVQCSERFGFVDSLGAPHAPFETLVEFFRSVLHKPITIDNCFVVLNSSLHNGNAEQAQRAKVFICNHMGTIFERSDDLRQDFYRLPNSIRSQILDNVPVSLPIPVAEEEKESVPTKTPSKVETSPKIPTLAAVRAGMTPSASSSSWSSRSDPMATVYDAPHSRLSANEAALRRESQEDTLRLLRPYILQGEHGGEHRTSLADFEEGCETDSSHSMDEEDEEENVPEEKEEASPNRKKAVVSEHEIEDIYDEGCAPDGESEEDSEEEEYESDEQIWLTTSATSLSAPGSFSSRHSSRS